MAQKDAIRILGPNSIGLVVGLKPYDYNDHDGVGLYALYRWLLPSPLPGIPYNNEAAASILGDVPALRGDPAGLAKWCRKQLEKHGSPICQALMGPLSKPVVLVADVGQIRELLMGRSDFDRSSYIIDRFPLFGEFHLNMKTGDSWRTSRSWLKRSSSTTLPAPDRGSHHSFFGAQSHSALGDQSPGYRWKAI
ncbi:hypothetical protein AbraIFM66950_011972 [Aspergillus brasiliensis]|nr:hypothetical protein AbraIFM66950_011972 [Aspergillus brasiliensis]